MARRPGDTPPANDNDAPPPPRPTGTGEPAVPRRPERLRSGAATPAEAQSGRRQDSAPPITGAGETDVSVHEEPAQELPSVERPMEPQTPPSTPPQTVAQPITSASGLRDRRIGIIGAGAMGSALCRGLIQAGAAPANRILVSDLHAAHVQKLHQSHNIRVAESNAQVARYTDIILLAVKPATMPIVLDEIAESLKRDGGKPLPLLISIAAGVRIETIEAHLSDPIPVVRAMPNTPAQVGQGACAYCAGTHADETHRAHAAAIFESVGNAVEVPETMMDAVTALSGSGPAYVYLMIEALVDGGVKVGLPRDVAYKLAAQTVLGAAQMVIETGMHPAQLRDMVTTPAGTTIAAIASLEHSGVRAALIDAVECATKRARELA